MLTRRKMLEAKQRAADMLENAGIVLTERERQEIEVADLGLGDLEKSGIQVVVYINTDRYCAKELVMFPRQTCPEHRHPPLGDQPGKMETFRCRWGKVWLYIDGERLPNISAQLPEGRRQYYTVFHEIELNPGDQFTLLPDQLHWFQAGDAGAIISEFSSTSRDEFDLFTDPRIKRVPVIQP
jgi:D-lyxose ketol-isomerase